MTGELDFATMPQLRGHLLTLIEDKQVSLVVDLDGLEFVDSSGLSVLVSTLKRARDAGGDLHLVCSNEHRLTLLRVTGLDQVFTICRSAEELPSVDDTVTAQSIG
jgi:anti-sigma B factor antagonist